MSGRGTEQPELLNEVPAEAVNIEGLIRLDVTVTDEHGNAVTGLGRSDFRVLDGGQPQNIIAFRAANRAPAGTEDSSTVILLIDTLDMSADLAEFERLEAVAFLRGSASSPSTCCTATASSVVNV